MFAAVGGKGKPRKHIMLGLTLKQLTSSKKVLQLVNRLSHCCSYNTIEELESEVTMQLNDASKVTPYGMKLNPHLVTGVAWDNYDRYVCTLSGRNTLHDTVGLAYQDIDDVINCAKSNNNDVDFERDSPEPDQVSKTIGFKRRRTFEPRGIHLEPYRKKPKFLVMHFDKSNDPIRNVIPASHHIAEIKDILWIMVLRFNDNTPMWVGWNSQYSAQVEKEQKQGVWYLPQINASPTSFTVVAETMKRTLTLADESKRNTISVTADLAVAKMMMKLQSEESPVYDRIFINFGAFHLELAFFHAIGKYIELSGGPNILSLAGVISSDSLKGFIKGTHFNRCKRIHPLFYATLRILHLNLFLEETDTDLDLLGTDLHMFFSNKSDFSFQELPSKITDLYYVYQDFSNETKSGKHGLTAQFWMQYMHMIELYHQLSRSIREGDFELYIHTLPKISSYFFVFNQPNHARWMTIYHNNLLRLSRTHPEVYNDYKKGGFGVKRTDKTFSRSPIDLTLEQTINADAASQRTGIAAFTNSISARQRWAQSHHISMTIITQWRKLGYRRKTM